MINRVIINADDFGLSHSVNLAISMCFDKGYIDRASIMVNTPFFNEAREIAINNGLMNQIGLHINLVTGEPLLSATKTSSLCSNGEFNGSVLDRKYYYRLPKRTISIIKNEVKAQIKRFLDSGFTLLHADSHCHVHIKYLLYKILRE